MSLCIREREIEKVIKTERKKWKRKTEQVNKRLLERRRGEREKKDESFK